MSEFLSFWRKASLIRFFFFFLNCWNCQIRRDTGVENRRSAYQHSWWWCAIKKMVPWRWRNKVELFKGASSCAFSHYMWKILIPKKIIMERPLNKILRQGFLFLILTWLRKICCSTVSVYLPLSLTQVKTVLPMPANLAQHKTTGRSAGSKTLHRAIRGAPKLLI